MNVSTYRYRTKAFYRRYLLKKVGAIRQPEEQSSDNQQQPTPVITTPANVRNVVCFSTILDVNACLCIGSRLTWLCWILCGKDVIWLDFILRTILIKISALAQDSIKLLDFVHIAFVFQSMGVVCHVHIILNMRASTLFAMPIQTSTSSDKTTTPAQAGRNKDNIVTGPVEYYAFSGRIPAGHTACAIGTQRPCGCSRQCPGVWEFPQGVPLRERVKQATTTFHKFLGFKKFADRTSAEQWLVETHNADASVRDAKSESIPQRGHGGDIEPAAAAEGIPVDENPYVYQVLNVQQYRLFVPETQYIVILHLCLTLHCCLFYIRQAH